MDILVNSRLRASKILLHIKRPYRFADTDADFEPSPGIKVYCVGTQTINADMCRLSKLQEYHTVDEKITHILLVRVYIGSADLLSAYSELAIKLKFNIFPYWDHEEAAHVVQELQRCSYVLDSSINSATRRYQGSEGVLHILMAAGLSKPKIRSLCEHFKTLKDICTSSVKEIAALPEFSEETAITLLRRLGAPYA